MRRALPVESPESPEAPARSHGLRPEWLRAMPCWCASAVLHLLLLLCVMGLLLTRRDEPVTQELTTVSWRPPPPRPEAKPRPRDALKQEIPLPIRRRPTPKVSRVRREKPTSHLNQKQRSRRSLVPAVVPATIGVGGGGGDLLGERPGSGGGPSGRHDDIVRPALEWLARHQSPDGGWRSRDFTRECRTTCQNLNSAYGDGRGFPDHDVGVTALAVLAFCGYGITHRNGDNPAWVACVDRGLAAPATSSPATPARSSPASTASRTPSPRNRRP